MPIIRDNWAEALEPGIREWFFQGYNRRPSLIDRFYSVKPSDKYQEHTMGFGAISIDAWDHYRKTGHVPSVSMEKGYKTTYTNEPYNVELPVQVEWIEDNLYSQISDPATALGDSASLKREVDGASVFNNAFSASYPGGDGVALASDSHPNGPNTSGTQDNNFALALSADNVETIRQAMMSWHDGSGGLVAVMPNLLIVPPELENTAKVITGSVLKTGSMDNDINPQNGRFGYVVNHYLTDPNAWFMVDETLMKIHLRWFNRVPMTVILDRVEKRAFAYYNARMRYSFGWSDWRWIAASNPS